MDVRSFVILFLVTKMYWLNFQSHCKSLESCIDFSLVGKEKKLLMQTLLPSALMTKIEKVTASLCVVTPDEVLLDDTMTVVYSLL